MTDFRRKTVLVYDTGGLFPHVAIKLAESFGTVLYYVPWSGAGFPTSARRLPGVDLPGVTRVYSWLNYVKDIDLAVFPDIFTWSEVEHLRSLRVPVWGPGAAEGLEIERWATHEVLAKLGMPTVPAERVIGTEALREMLMESDDRYVKCAGTSRGDFETRKHVTWKLTEPWLTEIEQKLGPLKDSFEFIVEEKVSGVEPGYDGYVVDGQYAPLAAWGYEIKDRGFVLQVSRFEDLPEPIREVNLASAPALAKLGLRGFYSNEIRIGEDGTAYLIDPTVRAGKPPSECYIEVFSNWAEVIWAGAHGEMVELEPQARFAAEIILYSDWVDGHYLSVDFPPELARFVKLSNSFRIDGQWWVAPREDSEFGAAIGMGDTLEEAIEQAKAVAEAVEALDVTFEGDVLEVAQKEIEKGRAYGVEW